jgi:gliding motility-associated-like protein
LINGQYYSIEAPNGIDTLTAANGCDSIVVINLQFLESPVIEYVDTILCAGEAISIAGQIFDQERPSGQIVISGQNGCDSLIIEVSASFSQISTQVEPIAPLCEGLPGSLIISGLSGGTPPYGFRLDGITGLFDTLPANIPALFPGEYMLMAEDALGCSAMTTFSIPEGLTPFVDLGADIEATFGDSIFLNPAINFDYDTLIWRPEFALSCAACPNPSVIALESVNIQLTAMSDEGCMATDDLLLLLNKQRQVYVPNAFSPNGDGRNDFFTLFASDKSVERIETLAIFDRWGNQVFLKQDFPPNMESDGWDGSFQGEPMDSAVFTFYAQVRFTDGETQLVEGEVLLLR